MPADMPIWIGEISQESTPRRRATGNQWLLRKMESFLQGQAPDTLSNTKQSFQTLKHKNYTRT